MQEESKEDIRIPKSIIDLQSTNASKYSTNIQIIQLEPEIFQILRNRNFYRFGFTTRSPNAVHGGGYGSQLQFRVDVESLKLKRKQRKILRKFHAFLAPQNIEKKGFEPEENFEIFDDCGKNFKKFLDAKKFDSVAFAEIEFEKVEKSEVEKMESMFREKLNLLGDELELENYQFDIRKSKNYVGFFTNFFLKIPKKSKKKFRKNLFLKN